MFFLRNKCTYFLLLFFTVQVAVAPVCAQDDFSYKDFRNQVKDFANEYHDEIILAGRVAAAGVTVFYLYYLSSILKTLNNNTFFYTFISSNSVQTKFDDIIGLDDAKQSVLSFFDYFKKLQSMQSYYISSPKGILLYGPPGNGKTFFAKAIAGELGYNFISCSGGNFNDKYIGVGQSRIKELFAVARNNAPCVLCVDEVDAIVPNREDKTSFHVSSESIANVNAFLFELDALNSDPSKPVIFIGTTNRKYALDPAVIRAGRLDKLIYVGMPDEAAKRSILEKELANKPCASDLDVDQLVQLAAGFSCVDCTEWVKQALFNAFSQGHDEMSMVDFETTKQLFGAHRYSLKVGQFFSSNQVGINFDAIIGAKEAKTALQEVIDIFKQDKKYTDYDITMPKGILLYGPPGNGKTRLARAFAGQVGMNFLYVNGSEFESKWIGEGVVRVKELFEGAHQFAPCVVFIDEIDGVGAKRIPDLGYGGTASRNNILNQLLAEMDGFVPQDPKKPVIVIGATNFKDALDPALLRPGRFDKSIYVGKPIFNDRLNMILWYCSSKQCEDSLDYAALAGLSNGMSGAEIENWVEIANKIAACRGVKISMNILNEAWETVLFGEENEFTISDTQALHTAQHEMGHALMVLKHADVINMDLYKVTIIPRGQYLGVCMQVSRGDMVAWSSMSMYAQIEIALGGIIAEELLRGYSGSGVSADLERATVIAREMVLILGLGKRTGKVAHGVEYKYLSDSIRQQVDLDVQDIIKTAEDATRAYLTSKKAVLEKAVQELCEQKTLTGSQVKAFDTFAL